MTVGRSSDCFDDAPGPPRIVSVRIKNYRVFKDVQFKDLTPLTVLLGPNGSGKSTVFDVFGFLSECLGEGLRKAWDRRGRFKELRSRDASGPIELELKYREAPRSQLITYHLSIDESRRGPFVAQEWLQWTRGSRGRPFRFLDCARGEGQVITGEQPETSDTRVPFKLASEDLLAVNAIGQLAENPRVMALRSFIQGWYLSYLNANEIRGIPEAGPNERLSRTGDNLPNVIQYLSEQHPERLSQILSILAERVPRLERVTAESMPDGRLLLRIKDAPFAEPFLARYASDGTLKMLAYLILLYDPDPVPLLGIEEPENFLHPRLLRTLAEECRNVSGRSQVLISTHSPFFVDALKPEELWVLERDDSGYARAYRVSEMQGIKEFVQHGAMLGALWMEGHFRVGDPLKRQNRDHSAHAGAGERKHAY
ncbi:MAG: AAA family ATPase [Firmicutes bacterium]|jgi:predicted ATPase|nr:AAA family ATPase [Bacillota bacterium]MDH7494560.1 AAA family ATPase [Bacillota bacterium]